MLLFQLWSYFRTYFVVLNFKTEGNTPQALIFSKLMKVLGISFGSRSFVSVYVYVKAKLELSIQKISENCQKKTLGEGFHFIFIFIFYFSCKKQKQPLAVFHEKSVPKDFSKFTGKHLCCSLFFSKVACPQACNFIEKKYLIEVFSCKILINTIL